MIIELRLRC